jgi:hypothetical protein
MLGGGLNGHDVRAGHANSRGLTLITPPRHFWPRLFGRKVPRQQQGAKPGSRLIGTGGVLLFLLGSGLLAVSFAAQYQYVLTERHQHVASLIEAGALDVGLLIFSLLALGLARAGLSAKVERAAVLACAAGSAVMNYAAADVTSPRSVLAYCMPPVFLAFVVDRVVRTIQRHVLGMDEARSPWTVLAIATRRVVVFTGLTTLYMLRLVLAPPSTCSGVRRAILAATPLPGAPAGAAQVEAALTPLPQLRPDRPVGGLTVPELTAGQQKILAETSGRAGTKTERLLALAVLRHGDLATIPLGDASKIGTALAPEVDLHPSTGRRVLLAAVRAALPAGEGDAS